MTAKAKKSSYHHGNLREELVSQGMAIVEAKGLGAPTTREIARRA